VVKIDSKVVEEVAALAMLELTEEEKEKAKEDLGKILAYMETMKELDTEGIEPMSHILPLKNRFREDRETESFARESLLANAPAEKDGCFVVPKTVE